MTTYARVNGGVFQLPARTFRHPTSQRRVTLVGMIYIAEARFYEAIHAHVDKLTADGALVLCEGRSTAQRGDATNATVR